MRKAILIAVVPLAAALAAGCGSSSKTTTRSSKPPSTKGAATIASATIKPYGTVLVDSAGHAIYIFEPDKHKKVTCTGSCVAVWPPVKLGTGSKPAASGQVKASLLGTDPNPSGGRSITYAGWPLYTYVTDTSAGVAHGEGLNLNGGLWYLISPSGKVVKPKSSSSTGGGKY